MTNEVSTTKRIKKSPLIHYDLLGQEVKVGDIVAAARQGGLLVCKILSQGKKMFRAETIGKGYKTDFLVYPAALIKLDGPDAMAYVLRNA